MSAFNLIAAISAEDLKKSLEIFWKGALAIAVVLVIVFLATMLLTMLVNRHTDNKQSQQKALQEKQPNNPETGQNAE